MEIADNVELSSLTTLAAPARAAHYLRIESVEQLAEAIAFSEARHLPRLVLGGGSNVVLSGDFAGLVLHIAIAGIEVQAQGDTVALRVGAGENWDQLVRYSLKQGWYGLENLIAIPGSVGAAPIQNIGAYGVELSSVLGRVEGWDIATACERELSLEECQLSYRDSIFKHALRDRFIITRVHLALSTQPHIHADYPALAAALPRDAAITPELVAETVAAVRRAKLPDPADKPNVGSFFKNPLVSAALHQDLQTRYPKLPAWPMADGRVKLAAGWLVEQCGFKGVERGPVGVHSQQALVLVNHGGSGRDILQLAAEISATVAERFGVELEIEPRVY